MVYELHEYCAGDGTAPFSEWLANLRDGMARARIVKRLIRLQAGALGDWKSVGEGVFEIREDYGPGYRLYFGRDGPTGVVLLAGGDKRSQDRDIELAQEYWKDWKEREAT